MPSDIRNDGLWLQRWNWVAESWKKLPSWLVGALCAFVLVEGAHASSRSPARDKCVKLKEPGACLEKSECRWCDESTVISTSCCGASVAKCRSIAFADPQLCGSRDGWLSKASHASLERARRIKGGGVFEDVRQLIAGLSKKEPTQWGACFDKLMCSDLFLEWDLKQWKLHGNPDVHRHVCQINAQGIFYLLTGKGWLTLAPTSQKVWLSNSEGSLLDLLQGVLGSPDSVSTAMIPPQLHFIAIQIGGRGHYFLALEHQGYIALYQSYNTNDLGGKYPTCACRYKPDDFGRLGYEDLFRQAFSPKERCPTRSTFAEVFSAVGEVEQYSTSMPVAVETFIKDLTDLFENNRLHLYHKLFMCPVPEMFDRSKLGETPHIFTVVSHPLEDLTFKRFKDLMASGTCPSAK